MPAATWLRSVCTLALCTLASAVAAQTAPAPASPPACTAAEYRQFDFWLGDWIVHGADGQALQGRNRIERSGNGCWLVEHWRSAAGNDGTSLNSWDAQHQLWRQFWVGADGVVVQLQGGLRAGAMVMTGQQATAGGGVQLQKMSWTPAADGSVTQQWDVSDDGGKRWQVSFLGVYRRVPGGAGTD